MKTVNVDIKKTTILSAYNQVKLLTDLDFPNFQKGEPIYELLMEIKRSIKKVKKQKKEGWREFLEFWPLSIVIPLMLFVGCSTPPDPILNDYITSNLSNKDFCRGNGYILSKGKFDGRLNFTFSASNT